MSSSAGAQFSEFLRCTLILRRPSATISGGCLVDVTLLPSFDTTIGASLGLVKLILDDKKGYLIDAWTCSACLTSTGIQGTIIDSGSMPCATKKNEIEHGGHHGLNGSEANYNQVL